MRNMLAPAQLWTRRAILHLTCFRRVLQALSEAPAEKHLPATSKPPASRPRRGGPVGRMLPTEAGALFGEPRALPGETSNGRSSDDRVPTATAATAQTHRNGGPLRTTGRLLHTNVGRPLVAVRLIPAWFTQTLSPFVVRVKSNSRLFRDRNP